MCVVLLLSGVASAFAALKPGTYTGQAQGIHDLMTVEVEVDDSKILSVVVKNHTETAGISDAALAKIPEAIVAHQSLKVDAVAGATVTSTAIIEAAKQALEAAGANINAFMADVKIEQTELAQVSKQADVIIVGGGGAGLAAAVSAIQNGAESVIVVEKMSTLGGSTIMAGGQYNAVDDKRQQAHTMRPELISQIESFATQEPRNDRHKELMAQLQKEVDAYKASGATYVFDSPTLHALQTYRGGDYVGNLDLILTLTEGAEQSIAWLEELGVDFRDEVATVTGALWQRTHQFVKPLVTGPIEAYVAFLNDSGKTEILMNTRADELIVEDGRVVGVKAKSDSDAYTLKANNGVIITTGGFARNNEMVLNYDKHWGNLKGLNSTNSVSATGDGIAMALAAGAALEGMEWIQLLPVGHPVTGGMAGNISINAANQLFINLEGKRFVAEDERRDNLTKGLLAQPEQKMFILHDAHEYYNEDVKDDFNETIGELVKSGTAVKGETLDELAQNMGVEAENLKAAVAEYNRAVAGEGPDPMGKKLMQDPFDKPPFYASIRVPTVHHTMGGLKIDTQARVLNEEGNPVPGLYAAGEVTGGIHGANRLGGNAVPDTVVFGRIAGESAVLKK
jgi:flavocytochrome c